MNQQRDHTAGPAAPTPAGDSAPSEVRCQVLFLCLYPLDSAPSQRFRFEQYFPHLRSAGVSVSVDTFYDEATHAVLYNKGGAVRKAIGILRSWGRRLVRLPSFRGFDYIFIQRGAAPLGPPVFEWILARLLRKKIVYDFDDAIWLDGEQDGFLKKLVSFRSKVGRICRMAWMVTPGNDFLAAYARRFTDRVEVIPTVVDTENKYNRIKEHHAGKGTIGWTGSHSTNKYLEDLNPVFERLNQHDFSYLFISSKPVAVAAGHAEFRKWHADREIEDLLDMDLGLMPLRDSDWERGKCGFKAIQYMALGMPAIVSDVGVNATIVDDGVNGYVCRTPAEWEDRIARLAADGGLRKKMSAAAREKIVSCYSVASAMPKLIAILK